jgi:exopolyphosphatase / guanosine-5'-triphosphate,3'-diphosphate pyrophosphatase
VTGEKVSARLGSGVDETGRIEETRISVTAEAIRLFSQLADLNGAHKTAVLATSAVRDAENGPALVEEVRERAGPEMRLISGKEEAILGFRGAVSALGPEFSWEMPALVVDLGGGSAQLIFGYASNGPQKQVSLPLGSNRTTERFVRHDPPEAEELEALREAVSEELPEWSLEDSAVVAIGGSARAIFKLTKDRLTAEHLSELAAEICTKPSAVLAREEGLAPERARVLPAASITLAAILDHFGRPFLTVVRGGIREGMILTMADEARNEVGLTRGS